MKEDNIIYLAPEEKLDLSLNLNSEKIKSLKLMLRKTKEFTRGNLITKIIDVENNKELYKKRISLYRIENNKEINIDVKDVSILGCNKKINIELFVDNVDGVYVIKDNENLFIKIERESLNHEILEKIEEYKLKIDEIKKSRGWRVINLINNIFSGKNKEIDLPIQREKSEYEKWLINKHDDMECIENTTFKCTLITLVDNRNKKEFCAFLDSIKLQRCFHKRLVIITTSKLKSYVDSIINLYKKYLYIEVKVKSEICNLHNIIDKINDEYVGFIDSKGILDKNAFMEISKEVTNNVECVYFDEDIYDVESGELKEPKFKPNFSIDMLRSINYIGKFFIIRSDILKKINKSFPKYFVYDNYDLYFKLYENGYKFTHVSKVLYHICKDNISNIKDGKIILEEHLSRINLDAKVSICKDEFFRILYSINSKKVSIIIPNKDNLEVLRTCINSILKKTTYTNYEIIVVENNSIEKETFEYYDTIKEIDKIRVIEFDGEFNYSAINNFAVEQSQGEYIVLLNNDIEIITPDWIENMIQYAQRKDVGIVGAKLYYLDDTIQHAGVIIGMRGLAAHRYCGSYKNEIGNMGMLQYVQNLSAVTAAVMMIKRDVYTEINGLDEKFKVAFNDIDFCMSVMKKGYLIVWNPFVEMYHYESISRGSEDTEEKVKRFEFEIERFYSKWKKYLIEGDYYFNVNLSLEDIDYSIATKEEDRDVLIKKYL
ncbi:Hypothetical protein CM240_2396 [Clostridium bornimense]|uniref:Glycosyltransferase 2-like domain-containing protein n=1 Tax=Clostridium bornimense TaxID=1216932 RepID=W6RYK5_9CLOT|nr:glycosyltransferase family 2 protein [Clostridium bornimense]CDM69533.1 Hypothetical protein CM240_2396 [Clostridium bornimense]